MGLHSARVLSLCTGIGGLDIGVKRALPGSRCYVYCEREAYCIAVLVARMQEGRLDDAPVWSDVTTFDGRPFRGRIDLVIGSYPCQGESLAGKGLGTADPRWLWPEFARIIREVGPDWCFFENVSGHLSRSFRHVRSDLQGMGYTVAAGLFEASEVGSPQKRERLFILAHASGSGYEPGAGRLPGDAGRNGGRAAGLGVEPERREPVMADNDQFGSESFWSTTSQSDGSDQEKSAFFKRSGSSLVHATGQPQREPADAGQPVAAGGRARDEPGDPGERHGPLEDAERERYQGGRQPAGADKGRQGSDECRRRPAESSRSMEHAQGVGRGEGRAEPELRGGRRAFSDPGDGLPEFPPGPGDLDAWRTVLAVRPDLAPAVGKPGRKLLRLAQRFLEARTEEERQSFKPNIRRMAYGFSGRVDRLRALGNAVVPAEAEYAFRELYASLMLSAQELPPKQKTMFDI